MVSPETRLPPWDPANEAEQNIILFCPDYKTMLNRNRPELIRVTQPGPLWSYLRKYEVTNKEIEEQFKVHVYEMSVTVFWQMLQVNAVLACHVLTSQHNEQLS